MNFDKCNWKLHKKDICYSIHCELVSLVKTGFSTSLAIEIRLSKRKGL
jgi:hypothetical protein